ncbi:hypothetical protein EV359DRAFT_68710 [Lentinula novae-zelandiae]|nr:hypothetical protein EV359DRAFT_68710 [Lentinula novae-zelandiae]
MCVYEVANTGVDTGIPSVKFRRFGRFGRFGRWEICDAGDAGDGRWEDSDSVYDNRRQGGSGRWYGGGGGSGKVVVARWGGGGWSGRKVNEAFWLFWLVRVHSPTSIEYWKIKGSHSHLFFENRNYTTLPCVELSEYELDLSFIALYTRISTVMVFLLLNTGNGIGIGQVYGLVSIDSFNGGTSAQENKEGLGYSIILNKRSIKWGFGSYWCRSWSRLVLNPFFDYTPFDSTSSGFAVVNHHFFILLLMIYINNLFNY